MNAHQECLPYAEHLQAEHRELHQRLRQLQAQLNNVTATVIDESLRRQMIDIGERLRSDLVHHFAEEESEGCLDYAASLLPALSGEVSSIEREHPRLLAELNELLRWLGAATPGAVSVDKFKERFDAFVVKLLAHEERENRIVQRGFNMALD